MANSISTDASLRKKSNGTIDEMLARECSALHEAKNRDLDILREGCTRTLARPGFKLYRCSTSLSKSGLVVFLTEWLTGLEPFRCDDEKLIEFLSDKRGCCLLRANPDYTSIGQIDTSLMKAVEQEYYRRKEQIEKQYDGRRLIATGRVKQDYDVRNS